MKSRPGRALWALTCVLFFFLALVAGYLALSKAYEHLAGEDTEARPPATAAQHNF